MSADDESTRTYESLYRFARETAEKGDRLPDWKKTETGASVREPSQGTHDDERSCQRQS